MNLIWDFEWGLGYIICRGKPQGVNYEYNYFTIIVIPSSKTSCFTFKSGIYSVYIGVLNDSKTTCFTFKGTISTTIRGRIYHHKAL